MSKEHEDPGLLSGPRRPLVRKESPASATPLQSTEAAQLGIEISVEISSTDGLPVIHLDTPGQVEGSIGSGPDGPLLRVYLNDELIYGEQRG